MASTNKTTNYELSQYIGTDKPTYLGDYNSDMLKIDTAIKAASDSATTANTNATAAQTAANNAQSTATTANNTANTADGKADTNATAIEALSDYLNINTYKDLVVTGSTNANVTANNMKIARNSNLYRERKSHSYFLLGVHGAHAEKCLRKSNAHLKRLTLPKSKLLCREENHT